MNGHARLDREQPMRLQLYIKGYRQPEKAGDARGVSPQGKAYQLVFQHQIVSLEILHISSIIQTVQVIFRNIYIIYYIYILYLGIYIILYIYIFLNINITSTYYI